MKLKAPPTYTIVITKPKWIFRGPFGYHFANQRLIEIYPPKWAWFLRCWITNLILKHEVGHAWGIQGCSKPWCLMFEAMMWKSKWKDVWWERPIAMFFGLFNWYRFCKKHNQELERKITDGQTK